jgi:hypothetical protein
LAFRVGGSSRDPVALAILRPHLGRRRIRRDVYKSPLSPSSFLRMTVGSRGMFVRELAMFDGRSGVLLRLFVLAEIVMMGPCGIFMQGCHVDVVAKPAAARPYVALDAHHDSFRLAVALPRYSWRHP